MAGLWRTRDGRQIPIAGMEDGHLLNTIRFLRRQAERVRWHLLAPYISGPQPSGEMAQDAFDREVADLAEASDDDVLAVGIPQFSLLLEEARRRGLSA